MNPETLYEVLCIAAGAQTDEERARIAWRFSDTLWSNLGAVPMVFARRFNDYLQDLGLPWVDNLWTREETEARMRRMGMTDDQIAQFMPRAM